MTGHADWFVRAGIAALAVDAPHLREPGSLRGSAEYMALAGVEATLDRSFHDWSVALAMAARTGLVDLTRTAYLGHSLGTRLGLRLCADLGPGLRAVVLGKLGTGGRLPALRGLDVDGPAVRDASRLQAPTLFHLAWDDEVFPRAGQLELFGALGSAERELHVHGGGHRGASETARTAWRRFIEQRLARTRVTPSVRA